MARFGFGLKVQPGAVLPVLAVVVAAAGVVVGAGGPASAAGVAGQAAAAAAPSGPGGTWGPGQLVPGLSALPVPAGARVTGENINAVTCTTPGDCAAVGYYQFMKSDNTVVYWPFTVTRTAGTWGDAQPVSGVTSLGAGTSARLTHVSCGAPGYCTAAGYFTGTDNSNHGFLVTESAGTWGTATAINDAGLGTSLVTLVAALSCPAAGDCTAVGTSTTIYGVHTAFTMDESSGTWGEPQPVPGLASYTDSSAGSVSCAAPGDCTAGGLYTNTRTSSAPFLVSESGHTWASAQEVTGFPALNSAVYGDVASVSCPDATDCTAVGIYGASSPSSWQVFTVDEASGSWGQAQPLSIPAASAVNYSIMVSCASAGHCTVVGTFSSASSPYNPEAFAASESSSGNWGTGQLIPGIPATDDSYATGVSCVPAGDCTIAGYSMTTYQVFAAVVSAGGGLGAAQTVHSPYGGGFPGPPGPACTQSGYCTLVINSGPNGPLLVSEATAAAVTLQDWVSMPVSGDQPYERLVATVTSPAGGTPTGTVTVSSGSTPVCTITLANGSGSCPIAAPAGSYQLTAGYSGDPAYLAATSTATVQVLSPSSIRGLYARSPLPSSAQPAAAAGAVSTAVFSRAAREISLTVARVLAAVW